MKLSYLLTLSLLLCFGFTSLAQGELDEKRLAVHRNPQEFARLDSSSNWLNQYGSMLGYYLQGKYDSARYQLVLMNMREMPERERAYALLVAGRIYRYYSENQRALGSIDSASTLFVRTQDDAGLYMATVDLIEHYRATESFIEAQALVDQLHLMDNDASIPAEYKSRLFHREAAMRLEIDDQIELADPLLSKSIELAIEANAPWQEATALLDLGYYHFLKESDEDYLTMINRAGEIWKELGYQQDYAIARMNRVRVYIKILGRYEEARQILNELQREALQKDWTLLNSYVWLERKALYESLGQLDSALYAYREYHEYRTALLREQLDYVNAEVMAKLGVEIARNQLLKTSAAKEETDELLQSEKSRSRIFIALASSFLLLLILMIWFYMRTRNLNKKISAQKELTADANSKLETALDQKNFLYRELHHRVKNNLANLSGLIYLQEKSLSSDEAKSALRETRNRIQAMSSIHKGLYQTEDIIEIELQSFLEELTLSLLSVYEDEGMDIHWQIKCEGVSLKIDLAIPLAMVVNEILTNSLKYAFKGRTNGLLEITGKSTSDEGWIIEVIDDGPGLPSELNWDSSKTLGMSLIKVLSEEIDTTVTYRYEQNKSIFTLTHSETTHG